MRMEYLYSHLRDEYLRPDEMMRTLTPMHEASY